MTAAAIQFLIIPSPICKNLCRSRHQSARITSKMARRRNAECQIVGAWGCVLLRPDRVGTGPIRTRTNRSN